LDTKFIAAGLIALTAVTVISVPLASSVENDMEQAINMLDKIFSSTMSTLDNGWSIAQRFKDPNYIYKSSDLKDPLITNSTITNSTITG